MGPICQAVISCILEFVRVNNKTGCALTDKPLTYSETVIFHPASVSMHQLSIYYGLFWQGLRRHGGDTDHRSGIPTKSGLGA